MILYKKFIEDSTARATGESLDPGLQTKDWLEVYNAPSCASKFELFSQDLSSAIETFFPWKTVKTHVYDKPWITVKLRSMIEKRQAAFIKYGNDSPVYRLWWNRVHGAIKTAKRCDYNNKVKVWLKLTPRNGGNTSNL